MEVIFILVPVSLVIVVGALWAFVWSVRNGQFDDLDKEAYSVLFDDPGERKDSSHKDNSHKDNSHKEHDETVRK